MTKKDYIVFAKVLNKNLKSITEQRDEELLADITQDLMTELKKDNKLFNERKFIEAVGFAVWEF